MGDSRSARRNVIAALLAALAIATSVGVGVAVHPWRADPPDDVPAADAPAGQTTTPGDTTGGPPGDIAAEPPLRPGASRATGDLADGLRAPAGTVLLGDVLPTDGASHEARLGAGAGPGWRAFLLVIGTEAGFVTDLATQAPAAGLDPRPLAQWSGPPPPRDDAPSWACQDDPPPDATGRNCFYRWEGAGVSLTAVHTRGHGLPVPGTAGRPVSLLVLRFERHGPADAPDTAPLATGPADAVAVPGAVDVLPDGWTAPPGPGEELGAGIVPPDDPGLASLRVPLGAAGVIAPWPTSGDDAGYGALLEVTGDTNAVIDDLTAQVRDHTGRDTRTTETTPAGADVTEVSGNGPTGDDYRVVATTVRQRTWVAVEATPDRPDPRPVASTPG